MLVEIGGLWSGVKMDLLRWYLTLLSITTVCSAKEPELPLCPTNIQYFPQNLPMHCKMPANAVFPSLPQNPDTPQMRTLPPMLPPFYQSPPPDKMPEPIPIPVPPGIPGPMPFPGPVPMPMMPMSAPGPAHKLPVIVMPFYSPDPSYKKQPPQRKPKQKRQKNGIFKKRHIESDETSSDTDTSDESSDASSERGWWKKRVGRSGRKSNKHSKRIKKKHNKKKDLLTPLLQYVTKDGYVIYEKKISKGEAKDWLSVKNQDENKEIKHVKDEVENNKSEQGEGDVFEEVKRNEGVKEKTFVPVTDKNPGKKHKQRQHKANSENNN